MFKFRYNLISGCVLLIQILTAALIYLKFGASQTSDVIFIALSTIGVAHLVQIMPIEQFMVFFHKQKKVAEKNNFWEYSLTIALLIGITSFIIAIFLLEIFDFFILNKSSNPTNYVNIGKILAISLIFYPLLFLNDRLFNSKEYFVASYILSSVTHISLLLALILTYFLDFDVISIIAWGYVFGILTGAFLSTLATARILSFKFKLTLDFKNKINFHKNSLEIRAGHNIVAVFFPLITNAFLAGLPAGNASLFYYAHRGIIAIFSVTAGPLFKLYMSRVSQHWSSGNIGAARNIGNEFQKNSALLYATLFTLSIFTLILIYKLHFDFTNIKFTTFQAIKFFENYMLIGFWQAIVLLELKYVGILSVSEGSGYFLKINFIFILIYSFALFFLINSLDIYSIPAAAILAQSFNFFSFRNYSILKF